MKLTLCAVMLASLAVLPSQGMAQAATSDGEVSHQGVQPVAVSSRAEETVSGINAFSLDLYRHMLADGGNLFLSPASVSTAVALAYRGAAGRTATELRSVLHYNADPKAYLPLSAEAFAAISPVGEARTLQMANAIWVQDGLPLHVDYRMDVQKYMSAGLHYTDFRKDHEKSRVEINAWVAKATSDRIRDLLERDKVTKETRTVLVNAIYWKGRWASPFDAKLTRTEPFRRLDGKKAPMLLMQQRGQFASLHRGGVQVIDLPYAGSNMAMTIFLPGDPEGFRRFESGLTDKKLSRWLNDLRSAPLRDTILTIPRMHAEWGMDLKEPLHDMGAPTPFSDAADFSGMAPLKGSGPGAEGLKITQIIHQARLDVDEYGAEAAASTAVTGDIISSGRRGPPPPPPVVFRADRPFFYLLRDRSSGLILFMGRHVMTNDRTD
ncbi:serpin family protein [Sphingobium amiense]|uniref:Serpin family protein n=1 Tax=Sphingobium amiense TaxID=135719 RepID=A0A494W7V5_9SPHN|nr:serpin family protein [Sphingobium amiense]BBD96720.1 serpin family protein [Sphingobium amiense]